PTNTTDGIDLSADPILLARSAAYAISYERRSKGERSPCPRHTAHDERRGRLASHADGFPDAPHVVVDVAEQAEHDELLGRHGWRVGEHRSALRELIVVQAPDHRERPGRPLLEERERLRPRAVGMLLRMLGVHLVQHGPREVAAWRPPAHDRAHEPRD